MKEVFDSINESRKRRGIEKLTWSEFLKKDSRRRERIKNQDYIEPDPPKQIVRPKAEYSNKSPFDKY